MTSFLGSLAPNYDVETAKAIGRQLFQFYAKNNTSVQAFEVSSMMKDTYSFIKTAFTPTTSDITSYSRVMDKNGDGKVTQTDLEQLCVEFLCGGKKESFVEAESTKTSMYLDCDGEKVKKSARPVEHAHNGGSDFLDIIRRVFRQFDTDNSGYIDPVEIKGLLEETYKIMGTKRTITDEDVTYYLKMVDSNNDGKVSLEEFEELFTRSLKRLGMSDLKESGFSKSTAPDEEHTKRSARPNVALTKFNDVPLSKSSFFSGDVKSDLDENLSARSRDGIKHLDLPVSSSWLEVIRRIFKKFDQDGNGFIDSQELRKLLEETYSGLGMKKTIKDEDVEHYLNLVDTNHDGQVSLAEFEALFARSFEKWNQLKPTFQSQQVLRDATNSPSKTKKSGVGPNFWNDLYDEKPKRCIIFTRKQPEPQQKYLEQVRKVFRKFDNDGNGFIDGEELKLLMEETYNGLGIKKSISVEDVQHYMKLVDTNGDGKISLQEYEDIFIRSLDRLSGKFL